MSRFSTLAAGVLLPLILMTASHADLLSRAEILESKYHEDRARGLIGLNDKFLKAFQAQLDSALKQQRLDEANEIKKRIDSLTEENTELRRSLEAARSAMDSSKDESIEGKTVRFPHNRNPDFEARLVFLEDGKGIWIGLGNVRVGRVYQAGESPMEFFIWNPETATIDKAVKVTVNPDWKSGTIVEQVTGYTAEAKIGPSRSDDVGR